ncbi:MAG: secretin N-terminal domain-containing protein [Candidatus Rifleibacteriota bacterium]
MKKFQSIQFLITILFLAVCANAFAELQIIKLSYSRPEAVIKVLKKLYGNKIDAASAPSINAIVINSNEPAILEEIDKLAKVLDRRPSVLKYSVKRAARNDRNERSLTFGRNPGFNQTNSSSKQNSVRSVVALEYKKARLTEDLVRIFHTYDWTGSQAHTVTTSHGLLISGHLTDKENAQIEVWYSSGKELESETLLTSMNIPLGTWVEIGTSRRASTQNSPRTKVSPKTTEFQLNKNSGQLDRCYLIKVDLVRY